MQHLVNTLKQIYARLVSKQFKISLVAMGYLLICYTLLRLGFFLANHELFSDMRKGEIIWSFIYGLRFDISALLMINGFILVLYNLPSNPAARWKWFRGGLIGLFWLLNIIFFTLNLADYGYFPTIHRRLMSEIYTILPDILRMLPGTIGEYYYLVLLLLVVVFLFVYTSWRLLRILDCWIGYQFNLLREGGCFILLIGLMILGIRGGCQSRPIRQAHAFFSPNRTVGYLVLNSSFTILRSVTQSAPILKQFMSEKESVSLVQAMLRQDNETMLDPQYPFLRRKAFNDAPQRYNVMIFVMESFTADYIGSLSGGESATPFLDSLAVSGTLFTNFLANGQRSAVGMTSILTSIPQFYAASSTKGKKRNMIGAQSELNNFLGLGTILLKQGYTTSFHHGAKTGSMGFDAYTKLAGLLHYYGKEDYPNLTASAVDGTWGIWDEEFFYDVIHRIDGFKPPFCSVVFSLTSHDPYKIPPHRQELFRQYDKEDKFRHVLRYSDYSLQQFFLTARDKSWFKNTIFIITGDHTNRATNNKFHSYFHIPFLIYAPGIIKPQRCNQLGSQVDILPTILDLLQIPTVHASMGRSLLDASQPHYAVVTDGSRYAIFTDRYVLLDDMENNIVLYDYDSDPFFKDDLYTKRPEISEQLKQNLYAYMQVVSDAIVRNRICRETDLK